MLQSPDTGMFKILIHTIKMLQIDSSTWTLNYPSLGIHYYVAVATQASLFCVQSKPTDTSCHSRHSLTMVWLPYIEPKKPPSDTTNSHIVSEVHFGHAFAPQWLFAILFYLVKKFNPSSQLPHCNPHVWKFSNVTHNCAIKRLHCKIIG